MRSVVVPFALLVLASLLSAVLPAYGSDQESVLHNFGRQNDGRWPYGALIIGGPGKFYGTTLSGGAFGYGAVFEWKRQPDGSCKERVLHSFRNNGKDGYWPYAGLVSDVAGNLYGTTVRGGHSDYGIVFKLTPQPDNTWQETILHHFAGGTDGAMPYASLVLDASGNLYGSTFQGGNSGCRTIGCGIVFELTPGDQGEWSETILHTFQDDGVDGHHPYASLIFDAAGNLYGATPYGPVYGYYYDGAGTVFKLTPSGNGQWTEAVLFTFCPGNNCSSGQSPFSNLILDSAGNLYGTTLYGGANYGSGTVFELSPGKDSQWTETVLHTFCSPGYGCQDGIYPYGGVIFDAYGNLWGTTSGGTTSGAYCGGPGCGTVFKLAPGNDGAWTEQVVHSFLGDDGGIPYAALVSRRSGHLFGTTTSGGAYGNGTLFKITP